MSADDIRAVVLARMAELGIDIDALAERMADSWGGVEVPSAKRRLTRWFARKGDMTTEPFAAMLRELGLAVGVPAQPEQAT